MALYNYTAVTMEGKRVNGKQDATDIPQLKTILRNSGLFLVNADNSAKKKKFRRLKSIDLAEFCRELGTMLSSGVTLVRAMSIILLRDLKPNIRSVFNEINISIKRGNSMSESMEATDAFPELLINMFRAGEESGKIDDTAMKMTTHYEKEDRLKKDIKNAMTYPIILMVLTLVIMLLIFTVVLPKFLALFKDMVLPLPTQILMAVSNSLTTHFLDYIVIFGLVIIIAISLYNIEKTRIYIDRFKLHFPKVGRLLKIIYTARFARNLSSLYSSGLTIISCLNTVKGTIGNKYIENQFDEAIKLIRSGNPLAVSLEKIDGFDKKLIHTIMIGEESGRLEEMLDSVADSFEYEARIATAKLITLIEPLMICIIAGFIAFVMVAVMLPIYQLYSTVAS